MANKWRPDDIRIARGPQWKSLPESQREKIADDLRTHSTFFIGRKYGISARTVANWRRYANVTVDNKLSVTKSWPTRKPVAETPGELDEVECDERDTIRCQCYAEVQMSNGGITTDDVARLTGFKLADVERELIDMSRTRCQCRLVYCEEGRWYAHLFNQWSGSPEDYTIRRFRMTGLGIVEAA